MEIKPDIRFLNDMREVLYDKEWLKKTSNVELYFMFRRIKYEKGLRYDITIIPYRLLGKEFVKTKGHEHPDKYPELYEVLEGKAIFLMQKRLENSSLKVKDVYAVKAKKGEKVFIPALYGHVTINPGPSDLKMANWVADNFKSDYSLFVEKQGACYYALKNDGSIKWLKNEKYGKVPKLRFEKPNKNIPKDLKKTLMGK